MIYLWGDIKTMKRKYNMLNTKMKMVMVLMILCIFGQGCSQQSLATRPIKLIVDGKDITSSSMPILQNDRTLVPVRFVAEELGAIVTWNDKDRTIKIERDSSTILLRIDSYLVQHKDEKEKYFLSDVSPIIINERTYVPLRLVSNALGIGIDWEESNKTISMDSTKMSDYNPIFQEQISTINPGQSIEGKVDLQLTLPNGIPENAVGIKYLLLDSKTAKGNIIARGNDLAGRYTWLPNLRDNGDKLLVAAIYDSKGKFLAGDAIPVSLNINPKVSLTGIEDGKLIGDGINLGANANFIASYVKYEIVNLDKNKTTVTTELDPQGSYNWLPFVDDNGNYSFKVTAYDENNKGYDSEIINSRVEVSRSLSLSGGKKGMIINKPVNLSTLRNFNVSETEYILRDPKTGVEEVLKKLGYGNYKWFPGPEYSGTKEILVRVKDTSGTTHESDSIIVNLHGKPKLILEGVGPKQVITSEVKIKASSNVELDSVDYILINPTNGSKKVLVSGQNPSDEFKLVPSKTDSGYRDIKAVGTYNGKKIESEQIPIRIYLDKIYGPTPIIEKDKFLGTASELAKRSWEEIGMSAALQTAQAILETGWGQSVPVDKYTGQTSNNLFGIKGKGAAGSVISNTWEEYNGTVFRIDAEFRAYNNIDESWANHKDLLLKAERYDIFREVMHDSTQGAWALRRAGYATDSQYPIKLMNIIKQYNLEKLDEVGI